MNETKKTCLYERHVALGALMSPFAGFDMPIQYEGIAEEHRAVRTACGVFDVSHMGEVAVSGPEATEFVNYIFTNDVSAMQPGQVLYGMMLNDNGGTVDDLLVYRRADDSYLLVINAANIDKDVAWITAHAAGRDAEVDDLSDKLAEIAVQGPDSERVLKEVLGINASDLTFYTFKEELLDGVHILVSRTGYTGEDGFEIYAPAEAITGMWDALIESGSVTPCGLGCRDTLRFEVGLPLYGNELADDISPVEASLSMFAKLDKPQFIGRDTVARQKAEGPSRRIVGLELLDRAIPRHGYEVLTPDGRLCGHITTGYRGISVDKSIAMAMVDANCAAIGTQLQVQIRRKRFPAVVTSRKFYKKSYKK